MNLDQMKLVVVHVVALGVRLTAGERTDVELPIDAPALDLGGVGFGVSDLGEASSRVEGAGGYVGVEGSWRWELEDLQTRHVERGMCI